MDNETETFTCFDGSAIATFAQINDGYADCDDGSDEPGTAAHPAARFYCQNEGSLARVIDRWSVGDGICDCCDGSDEALNVRSSCANTCVRLESRRQYLTELLGQLFNEGAAKRFPMTVGGKRRMDDAMEQKAALEGQIRSLKSDVARLKIDAERGRERNFLTSFWRARPPPAIVSQNESEPEPPSYPDLEYDNLGQWLTPPPTPKPPSNWQLFWIGLWKLAFHVPRRPGAWEPPAEYDLAAEERQVEAQTKLHEKGHSMKSTISWRSSLRSTSP
jgi:hypothetical protein